MERQSPSRQRVTSVVSQRELSIAHAQQLETVAPGKALSGWGLGMDGRNAAVEPQREEAVTARGAAVSRKMQQAEEPEKPALGYVIAGDALQVQIAATLAVRILLISQGHRQGVEAQLATPAAPGARTYKSDKQVQGAPPFGAPAQVAVATWADQSFTPSLFPILGTRISEIPKARQLPLCQCRGSRNPSPRSCAICNRVE